MTSRSTAAGVNSARFEGLYLIIKKMSFKTFYKWVSTIFIKHLTKSGGFLKWSKRLFITPLHVMQKLVLTMESCIEVDIEQVAFSVSQFGDDVEVGQKLSGFL